MLGSHPLTGKNSKTCTRRSTGVEFFKTVHPEIITRPIKGLIKDTVITFWYFPPDYFSCTFRKEQTNPRMRLNSETGSISENTRAANTVQSDSVNQHAFPSISSGDTAETSRSKKKNHPQKSKLCFQKAVASWKWDRENQTEQSKTANLCYTHEPIPWTQKVIWLAPKMFTQIHQYLSEAVKEAPLHWMVHIHTAKLR